jgi:hypothetical protein
MRIVRVSAGAVTYVGGTVTESTGKDISSCSFQVGLSSSEEVAPTVWISPDVSIQGDTSASRVLKLLVSSSQPATSPVVVGETYFCWAKIVDSPEVEPLVVQGNIFIK